MQRVQNGKKQRIEIAVEIIQTTKKVINAQDSINTNLIYWTTSVPK